MELIKDINEVYKYLDNVFIEPEKDECYNLVIFARRKYLKENEKDKYNIGSALVLLRRIVYSKDGVVNALESFENLQFKDKDEKLLPEHCISVFIAENPSSNNKAALKVIHMLSDKLYNGDDINLESLVKTMLVKSPSRKPYMDFDFDFKENCPIVSRVVTDNCKKILTGCKFHIVMTRGGFHLLLLKESIPADIKNTFYKDVMKLESLFEGEIEVKGDSMCPIPGCAQGGVYPKML